MHSTLLCVNQPEEEEEEEEQEVNPTEDKSCCECVTTFQSLCWSFQSIGQKRRRRLQALASQQVLSLVAEPQQPCQTSFICVKLNVSDLQIEMPCQLHMPELVRLNKGLNKSKSLTQRPHLHMKSRAIIVINIVYRHCVMVKVSISDVQICRMDDWTNEEMNEGMSD